jgi:hypothetical protein
MTPFGSFLTVAMIGAASMRGRIARAHRLTAAKAKDYAFRMSEPTSEDVRELVRAACSIVSWAQLLPECPFCGVPHAIHYKTCLVKILARKLKPFQEQIDGL